MIKVLWDEQFGCSGPEIHGTTLNDIKKQLDELYEYDVGKIEMGSGGPKGSQAPEWEIVEEED